MCEQVEKYITIKFVTEKKKGHGEDAPPLLMIKGMSCAVSVFDGMGGAGAATCDSEFGIDFTKAYVASRIVTSAVEMYLVNHLSTDDVTVEDLKAVIVRRLKKEQEKFPPQTKSMLRSKLVREYPTTMALVTLKESENSFYIDSYWAGDSHCYLWTKKGFFQISKDDLEEDNDPMENLRNDAAISNCICADRDFRINHKQVILSKEPVAILSATDGCFGYFPTPMHFEDMLKRSLRQAKDERDWENRIMNCIQEVTGDDTSLSLIGVGFESFRKFKNIMTAHSVSSVGRIRELESNIVSQKEKLEKMQEEYEKAIKHGWECYKQKYMKYLNDENNGNA